MANGIVLGPLIVILYRVVHSFGEFHSNNGALL